MRHLVFVYGTLLSGQVNHRLLDGALRLGEHRTEPRFRLLDLGAYPGALGGGRTAVRGEVYRVSPLGLKRLDRLEDYPRLYGRRLIRTPYGAAWIYLYRGERTRRRPIPGGDWLAYAADPGSIRSAGVRATRDPKNPRAQRGSSPRPCTDRRPVTECGQIAALPR